jgi:hypothetical protein
MRHKRGFVGGEVGRRNRDRLRLEFGALGIKDEAIREHQVAGSKFRAERSHKAGRDHEIRRRERLHRAASRVGSPTDPESGGDTDDFSGTEPGTKPSQAVDSERAAVFKAAPESGGFARECVKDQDHRDFSLSRAAFASKIAPVGARVNRIVTQARRIVRARSSR